MRVAFSGWKKIPSAVGRRLYPIPASAAIAAVVGWAPRLYRSSILVYFANAVVFRGLNYGLAALATAAVYQCGQMLRTFRMSELS